MQIQFNYLYRDAGNFKQFGSVVFDNNKCISVEELENQVRAALIDGQYFIAAKVGVPNLWVCPYDAELDHGWHEFEGLGDRDTDSNNVDSRDITTFLGDLRKNG
ncbi:MAG: hypothetical protein WD071_15820 [Pseudohongiella sp.]|uniref:hypothetical protein n=1 Tax=Pseudohongiella sp. TaxID=1979412 RepID=UPI0034A04782